MSLPNNQCSKAVLSSDLNLNEKEPEEKKHRRCDIPCQKQPKCPFAGSWRKDTKSAGGEKGWCVRCLKYEQEEI